MEVIAQSPPLRYGLQRARGWLGPITPDGVELMPSPDHAWTTTSLKDAINQMFILRACWGLAAEVRAIRPITHDDE
jgi:hypothetical protein